MRILAVDPSLTGTASATSEFTTRLHKPPKSVGLGVERLAWHRDEMLSVIRANIPAAVIMEELPKGSHQAGVQGRAELIGVFRLMFHDLGLPLLEVNPTHLKMFATGKGNVGKDEMISAAIRRFGFQGSDNNEADALLLFHMGCALKGRPVIDLPKTHTRALEGYRGKW